MSTAKELKAQLEAKGEEIKTLEAQMADLNEKLKAARGEYFDLTHAHDTADLRERQAKWKPTARQQSLLDGFTAERTIQVSAGWGNSRDSYYFSKPYERLNAGAVKQLHEIGAIARVGKWRTVQYVLTEFGKSKVTNHE